MSMIQGSRPLINYNHQVVELNNASREVEIAAEKAIKGVQHLNLLQHPKESQMISQYNGIIADSKQRKADINTNLLNLSSYDQSQSEIKEVIQQAKSITLQGANAADDPIVLSNLSKETNNLKNNLLRIANTKDTSGGYIFGGYKNDQQPFTVDGNGILQFDGRDYDNNKKVFLVGSDKVEVNFPPNAFFKDLYNSLDKLSQHLEMAATGNDPSDPTNTINPRTPLQIMGEGASNLTNSYSVVDPITQTVTTVSGDLEQLDNFFHRNLTSMGDVGRTMKNLEARRDVETNRMKEMEGQISNIKDISLEQAFLDNKEKQRVYDNMLSVQMNMMKSSSANMDLIFRIGSAITA